MKLVIAGSRTVVNIQHLYNAILTLDLGDTVKNEVTEIISGGANGADKLGEILATKLNKTLTIMPAEWDKYGKAAGYRRNEDMAELGDAVLVLYDGISKGSKHMIELAKKHNKKVWVYYVYVG
jgi:predicted Rossmann fold nucleotide-binding protein DprA/Smf involved in DNA uptake